MDAKHPAVLALALLALLSATVALFVRAPEGADLALLVAVSGPRLLVALAAGASLGVAGALADAGGPQPRREVWLHGLACGAAVGAVQATGWLGAGGSSLVGGALLGAGLFVLLLLGLARAGRFAHLLTGAALAAMLAAALVAAVAAKGEALDRAFVWWWLGDVGGTSWATAGFAAGAAAAMVGLAITTPRSGAVPPVAFALYGIGFGVAGILPWFSLMVPLVAGWLVKRDEPPVFRLACAWLGALALVWADTAPRLLAGGFAPPAGIAIAIVALPWFLVWGGTARHRAPAETSRGLRAADYTLAGVIGAAGIGAAVVLTFIVRILG